MFRIVDILLIAESMLLCSSFSHISRVEFEVASVDVLIVLIVPDSRGLSVCHVVFDIVRILCLSINSFMKVRSRSSSCLLGRSYRL